MSATNSKAALLQGSLDLLILQTLASGPRHGYAVARHLHQASESFLQVEEGWLLSRAASAPEARLRGPAAVGRGFRNRTGVPSITG